MDESSRVKLGNNAEEVLNVAIQMKAKHEADGAASPLNAITDVDWEKFSEMVPRAVALGKEAEELRRQSEAKYRERDILLDSIEDNVRRGKNLLKSIHAKNPKLLSEWGFKVVYKASKPAAKNATTENKK